MANSDEKSLQKGQKKFSTAEICRIIKLCKKNGVSELKIGEFEVSFHEKSEKLSKNIPLNLESIHGSKRKSDLPEKSTEVITSRPEVEKLERRFGVQDRRELEELEAAQLLIDDPAAFEAAEIDAALHPQNMVTVNEEERHW